MANDARYELASRTSRPSNMEDLHREAGSSLETDTYHEHTASDEGFNDIGMRNEALNRRTVLKLDTLLLPFLSLLFLLNSMDKSNIGNAESAGFTRDAGLSAGDLNVSLAFFFAFFVALQPVGAALGRKYGMARWVPACMSLWGLCTILHILVKHRWQLVLLRVCIASLEAGFYPTTVSYLSLFYTRFEFASRLGFFYGQTAVAGALGGVLSWAVFRRWPSTPSGPQLPPGDAGALNETHGGWKSWEVLFLIEGCMTIFVALAGFIWLPHSADTAWFFTPAERSWAEQRIRLDRNAAAHSLSGTQGTRRMRASSSTSHPSVTFANEDEAGEAHDRLLSTSSPIRRKMSTISAISVTADSGLSRADVFSATLDLKIWHLLICNILSAIPATAFGIFLPLVIKQLSPALNISAAASNLLAAPPFAFGAIVLFIFTRWSDRSHKRLTPILWGLGVLLVGLTITVLTPMRMYAIRYMSLCILLSGSFIASPLTVAWLANNTPEAGKRAILLGINGWGNLAGVFSALLFTPEDETNGYVRSFVITLICVLAAFTGFIAFRALVIRENRWRAGVVAGWTDEEREREEVLGDVDIGSNGRIALLRLLRIDGLAQRLGLDDVRRGDEKLTYQYGT